MERKIGEVFMTSKGKVKVVKQDTCTNCAFAANGNRSDSCLEARNNIGMCSPGARDDRASVIFALETEALLEQAQENKSIQSDEVDAEGFPIRMPESIFQYEDKYIKVVTSNNTCAGCYFANIECSGDRIRHIRGQCRNTKRGTPEGIIFKEVPKPIESQSISSEFPIDEPCATERPIGSKFMTSRYGLLQVVGGTGCLQCAYDENGCESSIAGACANRKGGTEVKFIKVSLDLEATVNLTTESTEVAERSETPTVAESSETTSYDTRILFRRRK